MIKQKRKKRFIFLVVVFAALVMYAFIDVNTSRMVGFKNSDRINVYIYMLIVISLLLGYNMFNYTKGVYSSGVFKYLWMITGWVVVVNILQSADLWSALTHIGLSFWWIMTYYFFYNYIKKNDSSKNLIVLFFILMLGFYIWANIFTSSNLAKLYDQDNIVVAYSYYILVLIPFIYLIENKLYKNILLGVAILIIIMSFKRGPIIILPIMIIAYIFTESRIDKNKSFPVVKIFISLTLFATVFFIINDYTNGYLSNRFSTEELSSGSGRDELREITMSSLSIRAISDFIIGTGSGSSVKLLGTGVHNEWLEFLYSFGLIGFLLNLGLIVSLIKRYLFLVRIKSRFAAVYSMCVVYVIIVGFLGGFYFVHSTFYFFSCIGLIEGLVYNQLKIMQFEKLLY